MCVGMLLEQLDPKPTSEFAFRETDRLVIRVELCELLFNAGGQLFGRTVANQALRLELDRQQRDGVPVRKSREHGCVDLIVDESFGPGRRLVIRASQPYSGPSDFDV